MSLLLEGWSMGTRVFCMIVAVCVLTTCDWGQRRLDSAAGSDYFESEYGQRLPGASDQVGLWWASSGWKVGRDRGLPQETGEAIVVRAARNESEAAQFVVRPAKELENLTFRVEDLTGPSGGVLPAGKIEVLEVRYVHVTWPTDKSAVAGFWPDPLVPLNGPVDLEGGRNQPFWVRVHVPREARAGVYRGRIRLDADGFRATVPLEVEVYDFTLPDRMTCTTAFGFSPSNVFRYHGLTDPAHKRQVLEKYWASFSAHHISPYDPAPLDPIRVTWPDVRPPKPKWRGGRRVANEKHSGERALLIFDDRDDQNVDVTYEPLVPIPEGGLHLKFRYRTAIPGQVFLVTLNHHDVSLSDAGSGEELLEGGGFEPPELPDVDREKLQVQIDFTAWDEAMEGGIDGYGFNAFRLAIPGMGGGTFHARREPELLGFGGDTPHYQVLFHSFCSQMQEHLREKGWLDEAFVYWFDEPAPKDYAFVNNGFARLKRAAPEIDRMLTEQVEPELIGGPNIWCPVSYHYDHASAERRREHGEEFWWYVCTGPKAPYCTLFIDHPGTELRVWLWQTWQRRITGVLVWQTNYWTSSAAYPDRPQNPYEDPMGWRSGYSTPAGQKRPWGNGDGRFIYPPLAAADGSPDAPVLEGPVDSIRWEMLRDGIEDYEYFAQLKTLVQARADRLDPERKRQYQSLLKVPTNVTSDMTTFTKDPAPIEAHRDRLARAIAELRRDR